MIRPNMASNTVSPVAGNGGCNFYGTQRKRPHDAEDKVPTNESSPAKDCERSETRLPKELRNMFGPLECKLCDVKASSTMTAKGHYAGKPHEKKVKQFLEKWCQETGQPMPKLKKPDASKMRLDPTYCATCEIVLNSVNVAEQHYAGKSHRKALQGRVTKLVKSTAAPLIAEDSRFGIGSAFLSNNQETEEDPSAPSVIEQPQKKNRWSCDLCGVLAHSEEQLMIHMKGTKHFKATRKAQLPSVIPTPANPAESILASIIHPADKSLSDYSMHRTPSGNYYCRLCNVALNSSEQFSQHVESKKHKFKFATVKKPTIKNEKLEN